MRRESSLQYRPTVKRVVGRRGRHVPPTRVCREAYIPGCTSGCIYQVYLRVDTSQGGYTSGGYLPGWVYPRVCTSQGGYTLGWVPLRMCTSQVYPRCVPLRCTSQVYLSTRVYPRVCNSGVSLLPGYTLGCVTVVYLSYQGIP